MGARQAPSRRMNDPLACPVCITARPVCTMGMVRTNGRMVAALGTGPWAILTAIAAVTKAAMSTAIRLKD